MRHAVSDSSSVLLADSEPDFRELLVNNLLLCGVENVDVVTSAADLVDALRSQVFDVVVVAFELYKVASATEALESYRRVHSGSVIILIDDDAGRLPAGVIRSLGANICILRSTAQSMLPRVVGA